MGDAFLREIARTFQAMYEEGKLNGSTSPYLYNYYNITHHMQQQAGNVFARCLNNLTEAFNLSHKMPRIIVFTPDKELVLALNYSGPGVSKMIGLTVSNLLSNIEKIIEAKKDAMSQRKPGSILVSEPKLVWVTAIRRPTESEETKELREKFNAILEESLSTRKQSYIIKLDEAMSNGLFDRNNSLTATGCITFW